MGNIDVYTLRNGIVALIEYRCTGYHVTSSRLHITHVLLYHQRGAGLIPHESRATLWLCTRGRVQCEQVWDMHFQGVAAGPIKVFSSAMAGKRTQSGGEDKIESWQQRCLYQYWAWCTYVYVNVLDQ